MTEAEFHDFLEARAAGLPVRRRPESIWPHDHVLARRVQLEQEAERATDDQARYALRRTG